jgi:hypothetical protein
VAAGVYVYGRRERGAWWEWRKWGEAEWGQWRLPRRLEGLDEADREVIRLRRERLRRRLRRWVPHPHPLRALLPLWNHTPSPECIVWQEHRLEVERASRPGCRSAADEAHWLWVAGWAQLLREAPAEVLGPESRGRPSGTVLGSGAFFLPKNPSGALPNHWKAV